MSLLDIIIPQYNENDEMVSQLLDSINMQKGIDFNDINIVIINDCSNVLLSAELFYNYPKLKVKYLKMEKNSGPGVTRQFGVDNTKSPYVTFIDADDVLYDQYSLYIAISCIKEISPEVLFTSTAQEIYVNNVINYKVRRKKEVFRFLHGKFISRNFLNMNNIRFHPTLRSCEDSYYCIILLAIGKIEYVDYITYLWKFNDSSLTRKKRKYNIYIEHFDDFFRGGIDAYTFIKDKNPEFSEVFLIKIIFGNYIILNSNLFDYKDLKFVKEEYTKKVEEIINNYSSIILKYSVDLKSFFEDEYNTLKSSDKELCISEHLFNDFLKRIV